MTSYHHGDIRKVAIEEARRMIQQKDFRGLSLRDLARRMNVTHAALYAHYKNKEDLLNALATSGFEELKRHTAKAASKHAGSSDQLKAAGVAYILFAKKNPHLTDLMFNSPRSRNEPEGLVAAKHNAFFELAKIVEGGIKSGVFRDGHPFKLTQLAWSFIHGFSLLLSHDSIDVVAKKKMKDLGPYMDEQLELFFVGIKKL